MAWLPGWASAFWRSDNDAGAARLADRLHRVQRLSQRDGHGSGKRIPFVHARTEEALEALPDEYLTLVNCWLTSIVESSTTSSRSYVHVGSGTYYEIGDHAFWNIDPEVAVIAYAATIVHDAVHVREYWHDRPTEGREGEFTALRVQLEVELTLSAPYWLVGCLAEIIDNIDDPAYQYWNGATPPCKLIGRGPATPTPTN